MKRFPEPFTGWGFIALTALIMLFPIHDIWGDFRNAEGANSAWSRFLSGTDSDNVASTHRAESVRMPHTVHTPFDGTTVAVSYAIKLIELPSDRQAELRQRFGEQSIAEIRVVWEQGKPEYYEVLVDRDEGSERVVLAKHAK